MNKKGVSWVIIAVVIIAIVVVGGVAYWFLTSTGNGEPEPTPTPSNNIETATSLGFKVDAFGESYAFTAKKVGDSEIMLRVDETDAEGTSFVYVFNEAEETIWLSYAGTWMDYSTDFNAYWSGANSGYIGYTAFDGYATELANNWSGSGDHDYTDDGESIHIYDIVVNPAPDDSIFAHG